MCMPSLIPRVPNPTECPGMLSVKAYNSHASDKNSKLSQQQQQWETYHQSNLTVALQTEGLHIPDFTFTCNLCSYSDNAYWY